MPDLARPQPDQRTLLMPLLLIVVGAGWLPSLKMAAIQQIRRNAIVGASSWMKKMIQVFYPLVGIEIRTFDTDDEAQAWDWLNS